MELMVGSKPFLKILDKGASKHQNFSENHQNQYRDGTRPDTKLSVQYHSGNCVILVTILDVKYLKNTGTYYNSEVITIVKPLLYTSLVGL